MDYRRVGRPEEEQKSFWLQFQVCSDGLTPPSSSSSSPATCTTFPHFADLPAELRLQIWSHLLRPRTIILACLEQGSGSDAASALAQQRARLAQRPRLRLVPALLHTTAEARRLALQHYGRAPALGWRIPRSTAAARVYFDVARDTLLLLGALEPYDACGVNAPAVYFLDRADARRVVHVAVALEALALGDVESEHVCGTLFHVLDAFPAAQRLLITSTDEDVRAQQRARGSVPLDLRLGRRENLVWKIWCGWLNGMSVSTSKLRNKQILMVREDGLADFVADCK